MVMTVFSNLLLAGSITLIWTFVNALQMIMILAMCNVNFPTVLQVLYEVLLPLASLDVIPPEISTDLIFKFSDGDHAYNDRLEELGFEQHNMIKNIGSMFYYIVYSKLMFLISILFLFCPCKSKTLTKLKEFFNWVSILNQMFIIYQEGYIEILVCCYLSFEHHDLITWSDNFSHVSSIALISLSLTVVPGIVVAASYLNNEDSKRGKLAKNYLISVYQELKMDNSYQINYNLLFLVRRIILVYFIFSPFFQVFNSLQIIACIYLNFFCLCYLMWHKPYVNKYKNYNEIFNEITIFISTEAMIMYTDINDPFQ